MDLNRANGRFCFVNFISMFYYLEGSGIRCSRANIARPFFLGAMRLHSKLDWIELTVAVGLALIKISAIEVRCFSQGSNLTVVEYAKF